MRLIVIGCEYAGKSTLAQNIRRWSQETMGSFTSSFHDHFVLPFKEGSTPEAEEQAQQILHMNRALLERHVDYMMHYHMSSSFYQANDHCVVNWYFGEAVYAPMYYGYGGAGQYADRRVMARYYDSQVMAVAPDTVLILLKASPHVLRQRMELEPCPQCPLKAQDIELVVQRFEEEYEASLIRQRFTLDTSSASAEETLQEFVRCIAPTLNMNDKLRILAQQALRRPEA